MVNLQNFWQRLSRRSMLLAVLSLVLTSLYVVADETDRKILIVGDSVSAGYGIEARDGWVSLLQQTLNQSHPGWRVVNASISGDTTTGGLERLPALLTFHKPEIVVIELGGNDGLRGQPIQSIRDNLTAMVQLAQQRDARVLLLGMHIPPNYGRRYTMQFHDSFAEVGAQMNVPVLDFLLEGVATQPELMQADRIHPTAEAQPLILDNVLPVLIPLLDN